MVRDNFWKPAAMMGALSFKYFTENNGLHNIVESILEDRTGELSGSVAKTCTTEVHGAIMGNLLLIIQLKKALTCDAVKTMLEDKAGHIWFCTVDCGVCRYDGKSFVNFFSDMSISSICEDKRGNIWLGTDGNGVFTLRWKELLPILLMKDGLNNNSIYCIVEDKRGNLWFGSRDVGLCRYDGKSFD